MSFAQQKNYLAFSIVNQKVRAFFSQVLLRVQKVLFKTILSSLLLKDPI